MLVVMMMVMIVTVVIMRVVMMFVIVAGRGPDPVGAAFRLERRLDPRRLDAERLQ